MKRISILLMGLTLATLTPAVRAQDAATEERLNKLNGLVQDLVEDKASLKKQLDVMAKEIQSLREQGSSASSAASAEDLKRLAEKVQEIDRKREADKELILKEIEKLGKSIGAAARTRQTSTPPQKSESGGGGAGAVSDKGYEYVVQTGDTLSAIVAAYKEQGVKVTVDEILKANPGLKATSLVVGKKIFIPAPAK
jgi:LysM repeat protein